MAERKGLNVGYWRRRRRWEVPWGAGMPARTRRVSTSCRMEILISYSCRVKGASRLFLEDPGTLGWFNVSDIMRQSHWILIGPTLVYFSTHPFSFPSFSLCFFGWIPWNRDKQAGGLVGDLLIFFISLLGCVWPWSKVEQVSTRFSFHLFSFLFIFHRPRDE